VSTSLETSFFTLKDKNTIVKVLVKVQGVGGKNGGKRKKVSRI